MIKALCSIRPGKVFNLIAICAFSGIPVFAQSVVNTKAFFSSTALQTQSRDLNDGVNTPKMPWVETYELRTETRDFDLEKQEYTLRLSPSTRRKYRAQTQLYRHQESAPDFDGREAVCGALAQRYNDWLTLYRISREFALSDQLELVLKDRATVLNRLAGSLDFDWSELIALREDQTELSLRRAELELRQARLISAYGLAGNLDFGDLAGPAELRRRLESKALNFADEELAYELEQVARELELERAEQRQFLDFAQVRYRGPHGDPARERLSVGVGLQLPVSGNQIIKVRELELEAAALRREAAREKELRTNDYQARKVRLLGDFNHFDYSEATLASEREELARIAAQLRKKEGFNPLPLLKIKERELRNQLRQLDLAARLYEDYLDQAERSGELCTASAGELLW